MNKNFILNEAKDKAVRRESIEVLVCYKSKDKHTQRDWWIIYGRFKGETGGFMFGKCEKQSDAKKLFESVLKELNK